MSENRKVLPLANKLAASVYKRFMSEVVDTNVINDRIPRRIGSQNTLGTLHLISISGKGGWSDDPVKQQRYAQNANVTLLDHLLSVTRGSLMLAAIDLLTIDIEMDQSFLIQRLNVIAAIAFLHDLDKMEQLERDESLTIEHVDQALTYYGIDQFLGSTDISSEQVRYLIEHAEDSQAHRHIPESYPPRYYEQDIKNYVKLADKLDGIWHQYGAEKGLSHLVKRLKNEESLQSDLLSQWQSIELFDPHHPFLLDELQRYLSIVCRRMAGIPPLIEVHQDGRLFILLPKEKSAQIIEEALQRLCQYLPFSLYLNISTVGVPELINKKPDYQEYKDFINQLSSKDTSRIFLIKRLLIANITTPMDLMLAEIGLKPEWPKGQGKTVSPYPSPDELKKNEIVANNLKKAASLALLLNLKVPTNKHIPNYLQREQQLIHCVFEVTAIKVPEWIDNIGNSEDQSRRTLLALWVTALSANNHDLSSKVWGDKGLLKDWLEGETIGIRNFIEDKGSLILEAVYKHFSHLIKGEYCVTKHLTDYCIFTNMPAHIFIEEKMQLHGVKVSAFTGREGRIESVTAPAKGKVAISEVSIAEYKLREIAFSQQGGVKSEVSSLVSSPVTTGLFSALILNEEQGFQALSIYDLAKKKVQKGKIIYRGLEVYNRRYRMARFEVIPIRLKEQIDHLCLLLSACLRIGRPIHIFRGLPTYQKAFFYYDAMPSSLYKLLGFNELRIEQIQPAINQLETAYELISIESLGYGIFQSYSSRRTRLGAVCLSYCHLCDREKGTKGLRKKLLAEYFNLTKELSMKTEEGALVQLGKYATRIQRRPSKLASTREELLVFSITLTTALALRAIQQTDEISMINGIAAELEINLIRKDKASAKKHREDKSLREECINFAGCFIRSVWIPVLKERAPSQSQKRLLSSIYRMSFLQASQNLIHTA